MFNIRVIIPDLYESDAAIKEMASFYQIKIKKWLHDGELDDLLEYLPETHNETKKQFVKRNFINDEGMIKLIEKVKYMTGLGAYEFTKNHKHIKHSIRTVLKHQFKKLKNSD